MKTSLVYRAFFWTLMFIVASSSIVFTQTEGDYRSKTTGNWSVAATWEVYSGGVWIDASVRPDSAAGIITIRNTHTVTVDSNVTIDQIVIETGATLTTNAITLVILGTNNVINGSFIIANIAVVDIDGGVLNVNNGSITLTNGSMATTSADPVIITDGTSTLSFPSLGGFNGIMRINSGTTTLTSSTSTGTIDGLVYVANNIGGDSAAVLSIASGKDITFKHDVIVRPLGTIEGPGTITFSGVLGGFGFVNNGTVNADVKFQQTGAGSPKLVATGTNTSNWNNVEIDDPDGVTADWLGGTPAVTINGTLTLTSGTFNLGLLNINLGNSAKISRSGGVLSKALTFGTSIDVSYTGTSAITTSFELPSSTTLLKNLTINNSGGVTLNADQTVNGTLILTNGMLSLGSNTLTISTSGSVSGGSFSSYVLTSGTGFLTQNVPTTNTNVVFPVGDATYNPLTLNNSGGTADYYSVRVKNSISNVVDENQVVGDQWTIHEAIDGGSNVTLTVQWNFGDEGPSFGGSRSSAQIGRYSGSGTLWNLLGTTVSGSDPYSAQTTSLLSGTGIFSNSVYGIGLPGALPVTLTSFTATANGRNAFLQWNTTTEVNNFGFEVERRIVSTESWTTIAFVAGAGTSNSPKQYSYVDEKLAHGVYVYRIKQMDNNGMYKYSTTAQVTADAVPQNYQLLSNYPNPFNPSTKIQYSLPEKAKVRLCIFDVLGRQVAELVHKEQSAGYYEEVFNAGNLSSGIYFYRLEAQANENIAFTQVKKMIMIK